jgi:ureidoacrylate peracid hydrolase
MHTIAISETARERVRTRVGKLHPFDTIEPRRTTLLVIDMQNYFVKPGHQGEVPMARRIVPNVNRLGSELRRRGGHVVWIRKGTAGARQSWSNYHDGLMTPERMRRRYEAMEEGQEGFEFWHENDIRPEDLPHQDALQRLHSRLLRRRAAPARARCRHRPDRRNRHQHLL